jgi:hypothetical protein
VATVEKEKGGEIEDFVLISPNRPESDIEFTDETIGEWSTGSQAQSDVAYKGLNAWEITSGEITPEEGNWGTVLAFQNGFSGDFSLFTHLKLNILI